MADAGPDGRLIHRMELVARLRRKLEMYSDVPFIPVPRALLADVVAELEAERRAAVDIVLEEKQPRGDPAGYGSP